MEPVILLIKINTLKETRISVCREYANSFHFEGLSGLAPDWVEGLQRGGDKKTDNQRLDYRDLF